MLHSPGGHIDIVDERDSDKRMNFRAQKLNNGTNFRMQKRSFNRQRHGARS